MNKRLPIYFLILLLLSIACNKIIEKKKQNVAMDAITDGRWIVKEYKAAGLYVTSEFNGYEFQFYQDGKVDGIQNTTVTQGNWNGDVNQMTITSNFGVAPQPLSRLNGLWKITDNSWTNVTAYNVNGADTNFLQLQKK
jgi:hypothetical protein